MAERQKGTIHYSTPTELRKRKPMNITLSEPARMALEALSERQALKPSQVIEGLILAAYAPKKKDESSP